MDTSSPGGTTPIAANTNAIDTTINPMPDAPVVGGATTTLEDTQSGLITVDRNAADGAEVTNFKITGITGGSLFLADGVTPVVDGSFITVAQGQAGLRFTPAANANSTSGTFGFTAQAALDSTGAGLSSGTPASLTVTAVNDAPSFTRGPDESSVGQSPHTISGWATGISAGPADEAGQALNFVVTADNPALFAVQPAISPNGTLTFTPKPGKTGTTTVHVTLHDNGGTANGGIDTSPEQTFTIGVKAAVDQNQFGQFAVGPGPNGTGVVSDDNPNGSVEFSTSPFGAIGAAAGVRTAVADVNADGIADLIVTRGPGPAAQVLVIDGASRQLIRSFTPFEGFNGGVFVAAGDVTGDGIADIILTPDVSGGPRVVVIRGGDFQQIASFFGIDDANFRGGARVAIGDINGDGRTDIVVAAGFGGGPRVAVFDGKSIGSAGGPAKLFPDIFVFESTLRNGAFVSAGDINGDGFADLIAGAGPGGGPRVLTLSGADLIAGKGITSEVFTNFFAGNIANRDGVRVAAKDLDGDNRIDLVVGDGEGAGSHVTAYLGKDFVGDSAPQLFGFDAFPGFIGGVFVG